ncbi:hypothetical protein Ccrd_004349 [Cynara cardunculus var. scolymus]|uniref:Uncharacterized protein n=1 Tax=Cynara cardunculus var. scolymus TaxID=59895 RepID=A0A103XMW5_CYNCS|nr:hypothetical protein Ccrd_004349 [Cynara cardunculus var. scolymus]
MLQILHYVKNQRIKRVNLASLNMVDKAKNWISSYLLMKSVSHVVEQFKKLQQHDSLEVYIDEFENLRAIML